MNFNEYSFMFPARIVSFDESNQTATVQISAERIYNSSEEVNKVIKRKPIEGVPVHTLSGGGWSLTMPIAVGDTCIIMFSQVGYDHWLYDDKDTAGLLAQLPKPQLRRMFDEDDGFCLVGFNTIPRAVQNFSTSNSEWRNANSTTVISVSDSDISMTVGNTNMTVNGTGVDVATGTLTVGGVAVALVTHTHPYVGAGTGSSPQITGIATP